MNSDAALGHTRNVICIACEIHALRSIDILEPVINRCDLHIQPITSVLVTHCSDGTLQVGKRVIDDVTVLPIARRGQEPAATENGTGHTGSGSSSGINLWPVTHVEDFLRM